MLLKTLTKAITKLNPNRLIHQGKHIEKLIIQVIQSLKLQERRFLVQVVKNIDKATWGFKL